MLATELHHDLAISPFPSLCRGRTRRMDRELKFEIHEEGWGSGLGTVIAMVRGDLLLKARFWTGRKGHFTVHLRHAKGLFSNLYRIDGRAIIACDQPAGVFSGLSEIGSDKPIPYEHNKCVDLFLEDIAWILA